MSAPTFNSNALTSHAEREIIGSIRPRLFVETLPGADGEFVQPHGKGGRQIGVSGMLEGTGASAALAHVALKAALRTRQGYVDGLTIAAYVGTDGVSYGNCIMLGYDTAGPVTVGTTATGFFAMVPIRATLRQLLT